MNCVRNSGLVPETAMNPVLASAEPERAVADDEGPLLTGARVKYAGYLSLVTLQVLLVVQL